MATGNKKAEMKNQKRTGFLKFKTITVSIFLWYNQLQV